MHDKRHDPGNGDLKREYGTIETGMDLALTDMPAPDTVMDLV